MSTDSPAPRGWRRGQIMCLVAAALPLIAAVAFSTDLALSLDPLYQILPNPEPEFREIVGAEVFRTRVLFAGVGAILLGLGLAAGRGDRGRRVLSRIWTQLALVLLILILPVGIALQGARMLILGSDEIFEPDPHTGVRWQRNASFPFGYVALETNDKGLRGPPIDYKKPANTKRVLFLGGAMAVSRGLHHQDTFPLVAERVLKETAGSQVQVINTALTGWRTKQMVAYMLDEGYKFEPDVVVLCVTIYEVIGSRPPKPDAPKPKFVASRFGSWNPISAWMKQRKMFGDYYKGRLVVNSQIQGREAAPEPKSPYQLSWSHIVTHPDHPAVKTAWDEHVKYLDQLVEEGHKRGYKLVIVAYPFASQLGGGEMARAPQEKWKQLGAERSVPVLDLYAPFLAYLATTGKKDPTSMFVDGDHHPTRQTAVFIGGEIAKFLIDQVFDVRPPTPASEPPPATRTAPGSGGVAPSP